MKNLVLSLALCTLVFTACQPKQQQAATPAATAPTTDVATDTKVNATTTATPLGTYFPIVVQGKCDMCKARIEKAALSVAGVSKAEWTIDTKVLHVGLDPKVTNIDAVSKAVAAAGHDTAKDTAPQAAYDALPGCCKYRS